MRYGACSRSRLFLLSVVNRIGAVDPGGTFHVMSNSTQLLLEAPAGKFAASAHAQLQALFGCNLSTHWR